MRPGTVAAALAGAAWLGWCGWAAGPWGVALEPPFEPPRANSLLITADSRDAASLLIDTLRQVGPPPGAVVVVQFLRGERSGRKKLWIGCQAEDLLMIDGEAPVAWHRAGGALLDLIGAAACEGHPLLDSGPWRAAT